MTNADYYNDFKLKQASLAISEMFCNGDQLSGTPPWFVRVLLLRHLLRIQTVKNKTVFVEGQKVRQVFLGWYIGLPALLNRRFCYKIEVIQQRWGGQLGNYS